MVDERDMFTFENEERSFGNQFICGVDEAGRGPLAGPVYAAAVILNPFNRIDGLDDSKKLSEKKRNLLFIEIRKHALAFCVASASEQEIDNMNILNATMLAMHRAIDGLNIKPDIALIDGNCARGFQIPVRTIVGGDAKSASIAAASILAKVSRDLYMKEMASTYPDYLFEIHKGYPTKKHIELLLKNGPCEAHRRSFLKKILPKERIG
ncbi:MAG: ribonuclease HII [Clostridiales bacterium]|nr:ribonuclease HII [Clostridiales bacterium]